MILAKFQEMVNNRMLDAVNALSQTMLDVVLTFNEYVNSIPCQEATLFDHVTPTISTTEIPVTDTTEEKPRRTRQRAKDGTMTASTMAHALSRELGRTISKDSIVRVAKQIKVKPTYCERQHTSRYSADAVNTIMNLYRSFNQC